MSSSVDFKKAFHCLVILQIEIYVTRRARMACASEPGAAKRPSMAAECVLCALILAWSMSEFALWWAYKLRLHQASIPSLHCYPVPCWTVLRCLLFPTEFLPHQAKHSGLLYPITHTLTQDMKMSAHRYRHYHQSVHTSQVSQRSKPSFSDLLQTVPQLRPQPENLWRKKKRPRSGLNWRSHD